MRTKPFRDVRAGESFGMNSHMYVRLQQPIITVNHEEYNACSYGGKLCCIKQGDLVSGESEFPPIDERHPQVAVGSGIGMKGW